MVVIKNSSKIISLYLIFILFFQLNSYSKSYTFDNTKLTIDKSIEFGFEKTIVTLGELEILNQERSTIGEQYLRDKIFKKYFFIIFAKGIHGESVFVFDLKKKKKVFSINSLWPVLIETKNNTATLNYTKSGKSSDRPKKLIKLFI